MCAGSAIRADTNQQHRENERRAPQGRQRAALDGSNTDRGLLVFAGGLFRVLTLQKANGPRKDRSLPGRPEGTRTDGGVITPPPAEITVRPSFSLRPSPSPGDTARARSQENVEAFKRGTDNPATE